MFWGSRGWRFHQFRYLRETNGYRPVSATSEYLQAGVVGRIGSVTDLEFLPDHSVDFTFASNLFEHLLQNDFATVLEQLKRKLKSTGTLNILQPNYRRAYREYFDDYTHVAVYSDISLCDFLKANGYEIIECRPGFLPLLHQVKFACHTSIDSPLSAFALEAVCETNVGKGRPSPV